jgi:menaquinone-dependent protoporphyrinogen IX oxidase
VLKALLIYHSVTGNTEKVAVALREGLEAAGTQVTVRRLAEGITEDILDFDLVCLGSPSYHFLPHRVVLDFVAERIRLHNQRGDIVVRAPKRPSKRAVVFVTYSGQHTGIDEATTAGKYLGQFLAHLGFEVVDEWYPVGEFHGNEEASTKGWLGDIRGRPNAADLAEVRANAVALARRLQSAEADGSRLTL